eukprot:m.174907 g.174907  ORF g.174907 m.174907 type:complete len:443 (+) comp17908_c0_seq1:116-1444(+)
MADLTDLSQTAVFLAALWAVGLFFTLVYSQLIGEIVVGAVLGPPVLNWVAQEEGIKLVGEVGLVLLVMEGGLSVQLGRLRKIGLVAIAIAVTGTLLPVFLGWGLMAAFGMGGLEGIAAGTALSSTSIGMATRMLQDAGQLQSYLGGLICVAAMVDDVLSLVILAVLGELQNDGDKSGNDRAWSIVKPIVVSVAFILLGLVFVNATPKVLARGIPRVPSAHVKTVLVCSMLFVTAGLSLAAGFAGSTHLLGAFVGGMAFAQVSGTMEAWLEFHHLTDWLVSIFFASIGFSIPVSELFDPESLGLGLLYTLPAFFGKFVTGLFLCNWTNAKVVGFAMVGRGELGFKIAQEAFEDDILTKQSFAISVWALLLATLMSPFLMRRALAAKLRQEADDPHEASSGDDPSGGQRCQENGLEADGDALDQGRVHARSGNGNGTPSSVSAV